jgi:ribonuclease Y
MEQNNNNNINNLTIWQRLSKTFGPNSLLGMDYPTYKLDKQVLLKTTDKKEYEKEKLQYERERAALDKEVAVRNQKVTENENKLKQLQQSINDKTAALQRQVQENDQLKETLNKQIEVANIKRAELDRHHEEHVKRLEKVANLSAEEAKAELIEVVKEEARTRAMAHVKDIMEEAKLNASKEAKKIIIQSIQRVASEQAIENAITVFNLESDEII